MPDRTRAQEEAGQPQAEPAAEEPLVEEKAALRVRVGPRALLEAALQGKRVEQQAPQALQARQALQASAELVARFPLRRAVRLPLADHS